MLLPQADGEDAEESLVRKTPPVEVYHVRDVYDRVASQWAGTRYKAWPEVDKFLVANCKKNDLVAEIGCGNGKNLPPAISSSQSPVVIANDVSLPLCEIASLQYPQAEVQAADIVQIPLRDSIFDIVLCIAVLHHLSTPERRQKAVDECMRIVRPGGLALFFAWAQEQAEGVSGHEFDHQDVFVPFHQKMYMHGWHEAFLPEHVDTDVGHGVIDQGKRSVVLQRYCHVFVQGELEHLIANVPHTEILSTFIDAGNWGVVVKRILD